MSAPAARHVDARKLGGHFAAAWRCAQRGDGIGAEASEYEAMV